MIVQLLITYVCSLCLCSVKSQDGQSNSSTFLAGPDFFVTDGYRDLVLTCQTESSQWVAYNWFSPDGNVIKGCKSQCTFRPRIEDDEKNVTCVAHRSAKNGPIISTAVKYLLHLKYPPPSEPAIVISPIKTEPLNQGDVITCTVSGGKPRVTSITFHCQNPGHAVREDDVSDDGLNVSSSITTEVNMNCTCSAYWDPEPELYLTATTKIIQLDFSGPSSVEKSRISPGFIGASIGAAAGGVVFGVVVAVVVTFACLHGRQRRNRETTSNTMSRHVQQQRQPQHISSHHNHGQEQPHNSPLEQEGPYVTDEYTEINNPYDVLQQGQDDGRTYTELMVSSTKNDGTYRHLVNDDNYEVPLSRCNRETTANLSAAVTHS